MLVTRTFQSISFSRLFFVCLFLDEAVLIQLSISSFWVLSSWGSSNPWGKPLFRAGGLVRLLEEEDSLQWACPTTLKWSFTHPVCKMVLNELLGPNIGSSSCRCTGRKELETWVLDTTKDLDISSYLYYTRAYIPFLNSYFKWLMLYMSHAVHTLSTTLVLFINKAKARLLCRTGGLNLYKSQRLLVALGLWSMDSEVLPLRSSR